MQNSDARDLHALLAREHAHLDKIFDELLAAVNADARLEVAELWKQFDAHLSAHMELEEREILPSFAREYPTEAERILADHAQIRRSLLEIGVGVDLHLARADIVERFVSLLKAHAQREDAVLYAWSQVHLGARERANVLERLLVRLQHTAD